jgi:DNA replication licensing factor MCM5
MFTKYRHNLDFCDPISDQLRANLLLRINSLEVDLKHVALYNDDLAHAIQDKPGDTLPLFETAATRAAERILFPISNDGKREEGERTIPDVQIMIKSGMNMLQFRDLTVSQPSCLPTATHYQYYSGRYIY